MADQTDNTVERAARVLAQFDTQYDDDHPDLEVTIDHGMKE